MATWSPWGLMMAGAVVPQRVWPLEEWRRSPFGVLNETVGRTVNSERAMINVAIYGESPLLMVKTTIKSPFIAVKSH